MFFCRCINECIDGKLSKDSHDVLRDRSIVHDPADDAIILCCLNRNVVLNNAIRLEKLSGKRKTYRSVDQGSRRLLHGFTSADKELVLKQGAPVIITINLEGAVNGTKAIVTSLQNDCVFVRPTDGEHNNVFKVERFLFISVSPSESATRLQFPLKLAFSLSIHRAQGQTLDKVHIDCDGLFLPSMLPVALSRVRSIEDLTISNLEFSDIQPIPDIIRRWYEGEEVDFQSNGQVNLGYQ